ncbi:hypothetical protein B6D17_09470 [Gilliamella apis]|uniref:glycosyltransferase family 8 protein n=1 Tax=Gilliamella apis TaxID=1970738 RepID=UPI000A335DF0|nr:glycosyltransferase [Gilliamella apis]OTQ70154.1 hypothetical protein B6D17_09470 [Gilliamella apis]OTQ74669.1 hypothetical protein B6C90_07920 [Gilliamella apis]
MENDMHYSDKFLKNILVLNKNVQVTEGYHIAYCFDDNYAMPAGLSLMSVIENNPNIAINFHLFTNNLSKQNLAHFETLAKQFDCSITCYEIDSNFSVNSDTLVLGISIATCLRFIVPEVLEKITSRVLYLDCDTLCVGNLEGLFNRDLTNKIAAVVPDIENMQNTQGKRYGIPYGEYFNAGVIFFNTLLWNHNKLTEKTFQLINDGNVYTFADQDVLNIVMKENTLLLTSDYNNLTALTVNGNEDAKVYKTTKIIHYITKNKPWHQPYRTNLFDYYFTNSPWKDMLLPFYNDNKTSSIRAYAKLMFKQKKYLSGIKHYIIYLKTKFKK